MLGRGFVAIRLTFAGASAFIKTLRPSSSTTLAMCPPPFCANKGAKNAAERIPERASVARISHPQFVVRLSIHHASAVRAPTFELQLHCGHYSRTHRYGQCDFRTMRHGPAVRHAAEPLEVTGGPPRAWSA